MIWKCQAQRDVGQGGSMEYKRILLSHKEGCNNASCSNMDATRDDHTKGSHSERKRQIPYDIPFMWNLKYGTNGPIYKIETDSERTDLWLPRERGKEVGWTRNLGLVGANYDICNEILLSSTGNCIQSPGIDHDGDNIRKGMCIYV